jgi:HEAT repeat protein
MYILVDSEAPEGLLVFLDDPDASIRKNVVFMLGALGRTFAAEPVRRALADADRDVRVAALKALAQLNPENASTPIAEVLGDPDPWIRIHGSADRLSRAW